MVIVTDAKTGFFNHLISERVVVFVSTDVDGVSTWRILKHLFKCRHILYTVIPVQNKEELLYGYQENLEGVSRFVLINCGANFDVIDLFNPPELTDLVFYIVDSHRPIHVNNFYNQRRVKLLTHEEKLDSIPNFDDIFREDSSDADSDEEEGARAKRGRFDEDYLERRIRRREWKTKKDEILLEYESYSYHATASSLVMFDLAWKLSQDNTHLLWYAIIGQTSQLLYQRVNRDRYIPSVDYLQNHASRLGHQQGAALDGENTRGALQVVFLEDLSLWLYRHWSLREALETSLLTTSRFKLFTIKGKKKMLDLLAQTGIPIKQCDQTFSAMDINIKNNLTALFAQHGGSFGLDRRELFLPSFVAQTGYKAQVSAMDVAFVCAAVLECADNGVATENFQGAMEMLSCSHSVSFSRGMDLAQRQLKTLVSQVKTLLDTDDVIVFGPFLYVHVPHNSMIATYLRNPLAQVLLAKYTLASKASVRPTLGRNRRTAQMPLILCMDTHEPGQLVLVGIPPLQGDDDRNLFGQAFETAAKTTRSRTVHKRFDSHIIEMNKEDMLKLFDAIASMLT